ncbi:MAG: 3-deoxy-7-phosphoheptulonate synthase [Acidimicrobiia bacterium]|nr:3-deoxy-7-phosphoheptulonate synthase [Acidimicrobiia bacterium]
MTRKTDRSQQPDDTIVTVGPVRFGADPFPVIAGPCTIESADQLRTIASAVADAGANVLRGGTTADGSSPYGYRGLGPDGIKMLVEAGKEHGLPVVTQVTEPDDVELVAEHVDLLELAASNMQNFELLRVVGQSNRPVLVKRAPSATIDEWLWAAEYVLAEGNTQVVLCERGIRTFGERATLDLASVATVKERSHLPVLVFPSHAVGSRSHVARLSLAALGVGADGLVVEVHPDPDHAVGNPGMQVDLGEFTDLMASLGVHRLRTGIDAIDRSIVRLLAERTEISLAIGEVKARRGEPIRSLEREAELLDVIRREAATRNLDPAFAQGIFEAILEHSREEQKRMRSGDDS